MTFRKYCLRQAEQDAQHLADEAKQSNEILRHNDNAKKVAAETERIENKDTVSFHQRLNNNRKSIEHYRYA